MRPEYHQSRLIQPFKSLYKIFLTLVILLSYQSVHGSDIIAEDVLTALENKYGGKSFEVNFRQVSRLAALEITEEASGTALFSHPGKMRWRYQLPQHHEIITNGQSLWIYRPDENQVILGDAGQFFKYGAGGAFLSDISLIRKNFTIKIKAVTADHVDMGLTARNKDQDLTSIVIRISQKTSEIIQITTYNAYDDSTRFELTSTRFKQVNPDLFDFKIPEQADVIKEGML